MTRVLTVLLLIVLLASCRSTRKIQSAIGKKDTASATVRVPESPKNDTQALIRSSLQGLAANHINYRTFSAKVNVDYKGGDGKSYNVNAVVRMYKDSAIWISANAILGIEAMRVLITRDSVKLLNKLNKTYTARSVDYLQDVTALPLNLATLQDLIVGNPLFIDSTGVSYSAGGGVVSLMSVGQWFKNLITLNASDMTLLHSKLDDRDMTRNRTADLTYNEYEQKKVFPFSTKRRIAVAEKTRLDIRLDFKQYDFNEEVSFPFSIPKNYDRD
jgi:hypothetical protein